MKIIPRSKCRIDINENEVKFPKQETELMSFDSLSIRIASNSNEDLVAGGQLLALQSHSHLCLFLQRTRDEEQGLKTGSKRERETDENKSKGKKDEQQRISPVVDADYPGLREPPSPRAVITARVYTPESPEK